MNFDIFLREQNIERYRRLLDPSVEPTERRTILNLLAEEMETLKNENKQKPGGAGSMAPATR